MCKCTIIYLIFVHYLPVNLSLTLPPGKERIMNNSVTIKDIAGALGLSRNTVSKALNGKHVPPKTRDAVLNTAIEMGYRGYGLVTTAAAPAGPTRFIILSSQLLMNINYYVHVLRGIEESLADRSIDLVQFCVTSPESFERFKKYLSQASIEGIICIEFFETAYIIELLKFGCPVIFLDYPVTDTEIKGNYDIVLPENTDTVKRFCMSMIREGKARTFGFVGEYLHCRSFYERFTGMREALFLSGLPVDLSYSVTDTDAIPYNSESLEHALRRLPALPDCFVAANDTIAIALLDALKRLGVDVPGRVKVIGFDNVAESKKSDPPLSTVNVNKTALGKRITALLLDRINLPARSNQVIHIASTVITRSTT